MKWWSTNFQLSYLEQLLHSYTISILRKVLLQCRLEYERIKNQRWSSRGRSWPRGHSLRSLALASKPQVLGLGLEASSPWPWPRSLKSSKIVLSSARGQHYFLNSWNFVGKRQKPRGKFASTFFVFLTWSIRVAKRRRGRESAPSLIEISPMTKMWQKSLLFLQFQFRFSIFCLQQYN